MASDRQIAANRRNAQRSTGPRSSGGKARASHNSYRHGLSVRTAPTPEIAKRIDSLAGEIAGETTNAVILESARAAAQAEFDLTRVREVRAAMIQRALAWEPGSVAPAGATAPSAEPERVVKIVRRAVSELGKLDRYERRAAALRDRAVRVILRAKIDNKIRSRRGDKASPGCRNKRFKTKSTRSLALTSLVRSAANVPL
jgi:hypothetical protein